MKQYLLYHWPSHKQEKNRYLPSFVCHKLLDIVAYNHPNVSQCRQHLQDHHLQ